MSGALEYAKALFLLTEECGTTERVFGEMELLRSLLSEQPDYTRLLDTPALSKEERLSLISESFGDLDENLVNLVKILAEGRCAHLIPKLCDSYTALYNEAHGILHAEAITAYPLTEEQTASIAKKLSEKTGKTVTVKNIIDKSTLGGVVLRYAGVQLDGSVKTRLDKFEDALRTTVI